MIAAVIVSAIAMSFILILDSVIFILPCVANFFLQWANTIKCGIGRVWPKSGQFNEKIPHKIDTHPFIYCFIVFSFSHTHAIARSLTHAFARTLTIATPAFRCAYVKIYDLLKLLITSYAPTEHFTRYVCLCAREFFNTFTF